MGGSETRKLEGPNEPHGVTVLSDVAATDSSLETTSMYWVCDSAIGRQRRIKSLKILCISPSCDHEQPLSASRLLSGE